MKVSKVILASVLGLSLSGGALLAELGDASKLPAAATKKVSFSKDIKPILEDKCIDCHGPDKQKSKYRVDVRDEAIKGGSSDEVAIIVGNSAKSPFVHYVARLVEDLEMPPKEKYSLTKDEIALIRAWVDQGVKFE